MTFNNFMLYAFVSLISSSFIMGHLPAGSHFMTIPTTPSSRYAELSEYVENIANFAVNDLQRNGNRTFELEKVMSEHSQVAQGVLYTLALEFEKGFVSEVTFFQPLAPINVFSLLPSGTLSSAS
jgi:hypothetical protein